MDKTGHIIRGSILLIVAMGIALWIGFRWLKRSDDPGKIFGKWVATGVLLFGLVYFAASPGFSSLFAIVLLGTFLGLIWAPEVASVLASPLMNAIDGGSTPPERKATYSAALARRKQGKVAEAVEEIQTQLEEFPENFEGLSLLADIQAEDLKDPKAALTTLESIIATPNRPANHVVFALNAIADYQLKYFLDPDAARSALERTSQLFPDSEFAYHASQRIAHLATREQLTARREERRIALPVRDPAKQRLGQAVPEEDLDTQAAGLIKRLASQPNDHEAREQLGLLYGQQMQRMDLARDQFERLIATPNVPSREIVRWLNVLANMEIEVEGNEIAARAALQRIVDLYPETPASTQAQQRMDSLGLERRFSEKRSSVRLGSYERDLGLRKKS